MNEPTSQSPARFLSRQLIYFLLFGILTQFVFFQDFNFYTLNFIQHYRSALLDYGLAPFILLGSPEISVSLILIFSIMLYRKKRYKRAYLLIAGLLVLTGIEFIMKHSFVHPRIPYELRRGFPGVPGVGMLTVETPYSFPSGHSLRSMFLIGTLLIWSPFAGITCRKRLIGLFFCIQAFGMNYYGFHWLADVVAGYWLAVIGVRTLRRIESK